MSADQSKPSATTSALLPGNAGVAAQLVFAVLAAAAVYSFILSSRNAEQRRLCTPTCALAPHYANSDRMAPDFELPTLQGDTRKLSDYRGKVVILNFWTKSCRPCLEEMPSIATLTDIVRAQFPDIEVLTVSTDESVEDARNTLASILNRPAPFTTFVDAENEVVADRYGTKLYPETWYIDKKGVIRARIDGSRDWKQPLALELAQALTGATTCQAEFEDKQPIGAFSESVCADIPLAL